MEDLTKNFKNITDEIKEYYWYKQRPFTEDEWAHVRCCTFLNSENNFIFVGYLRSVEYPVFVIKASLDECNIKEKYAEILAIENEYISKRNIYHANGTGATSSFHKGTYGLVYNNLVTINDSVISKEFYPIRDAYAKAKKNAKLLTELIDWCKFSAKIDAIDTKAKDWIWGYNQYPSLMEFLYFRDNDFTFLLLSEDENVQNQYKRFISHLFSEYQADGALR